MAISMNAASAAAYSAAATSGAQTTSSNSLATPSKEMFLQLLVAQIKNQDPLNPSDGTQFLTQLAQFSELEQLISIRDGIDSLNQLVTPSADSDSTTK